MGFAAAENTLRAFLRAVAPLACNKATAEFKSIYECLLRTHIAAKEEQIALLDLLRLIRNTIHNEGIHRPRGDREEVVQYKGTRYTFETGGVVEVMTWRFVIERVGDLMELLDEVAEAPLIASFAGRIPYDSLEILPPAT